MADCETIIKDFLKSDHKSIRCIGKKEETCLLDNLQFKLSKKCGDYLLSNENLSIRYMYDILYNGYDEYKCPVGFIATKK